MGEQAISLDHKGIETAFFVNYNLILSSLHLRYTWQVEENAYSCSLNFVGLKKLALCSTVPGTLIYVGQISFDCKYLNQLRIKSYLGFSWDGKSSAIKKWHFFLHLIYLLLRAHDGLLQNNCVYTHSTSRDETSKILCNSNKNPAQFRLAFHPSVLFCG